MSRHTAERVCRFVLYEAIESCLNQTGPSPDPQPSHTSPPAGSRARLRHQPGWCKMDVYACEDGGEFDPDEPNPHLNLNPPRYAAGIAMRGHAELIHHANLCDIT